MKIGNAVFDDLTIAKPHYFGSIAGLLQPCLKLYLKDQPMPPLLFDHLWGLVKTLFNKYYQFKCTSKIKNSEAFLKDFLNTFGDIGK